MWVCGVNLSKGVAFINQSLGSISQVRDHVRDVATGDVFFGGFSNDAPELPLAGITGGRQLQVGEALLRFPGVGAPVCLTEVGESMVGGSGKTMENALPRWMRMGRWSELRVVIVDHSESMAM